MLLCTIDTYSIKNFFFNLTYQRWKTTKNNTIGAVPKSTRKIIEIYKIDTPNKQEHDRSHCWRGTGSLQYKVVALN
jgi:wobble nucleotide-excising tRNase